MAGGAPAGARFLPGALGCLTKRTSIRTTTRTGNRITRPTGAVIVELPHNRSGLLKKAIRELMVLLLYPLDLSSSSEGNWIARVDAPLARRTGSFDIFFVLGLPRLAGVSFGRPGDRQV